MKGKKSKIGSLDIGIQKIHVLGGHAKMLGHIDTKTSYISMKQIW